MTLLYYSQKVYLPLRRRFVSLLLLPNKILDPLAPSLRISLIHGILGPGSAVTQTNATLAEKELACYNGI